MTLYEDLGVGKTADQATIKKAHKRKAMKTHPDRPGGSAEKFKQVQHAYDVLSDPTRRERYDLGGDENPVPPVEVQAKSEIIKCFAQFLGQKNVNIPKRAQKCFEQGQARLKSEKRKLLQGRTDLVAQRDSVSCDAPENLFTQLIDSQIAAVDELIGKNDATFAVNVLALKILQAYRSGVIELMTPTQGFSVLDHLNRNPG